jgi:hypothetical protein
MNQRICIKCGDNNIKTLGKEFACNACGILRMESGGVGYWAIRGHPWRIFPTTCLLILKDKEL